MASRNGEDVRNPHPSASAINGSSGQRTTRVLPVHRLNTVVADWAAESASGSAEAKALLEAAETLRTSDVPVAFPTETVYGLGADATRSAAVQGIYKAKQRPSDNPLIVHVSSREQLQRILQPPPPPPLSTSKLDHQEKTSAKPPPTTTTTLIPLIYEPLISRFWPGPLTIILPNPPHSPLAPEVTSNLPTFGARMPSSPLARLLIQLADRPLAAPSANASTKPSPTTAQHVYADLQGRIDIILDGGPCGVGVESTVVDGLSDPPAILRPGGIGIEEIRACPGWANVRTGYKDGALQSKEAPRAPGMKYKHYSPRAKVVLFEAGLQDLAALKNRVRRDISVPSSSSSKAIRRIGVVRTKTWKKGLGFSVKQDPGIIANGYAQSDSTTTNGESANHSAAHSTIPTRLQLLLPTSAIDQPQEPPNVEMFDIELGTDTGSIARGLFSALRGLDEKNVSVIYVEGILDTEGDLAAAIMNRLRKAAEEEIRS
ncbi:Sua5/YciO/YrdC/YwlC family tRNA threonylcarbamoyl adenosine modification protein [Polytolypa hystricis UAMH7299]|uniref:Threonylcarbamoyl-AMP synthase n=1 Tax=Polytolypa hystricis (strain UAMH7299) TaxID=1447883 RepID=A0A2B7XDT3_POLH7|nr:Sua5/YciO/YrdC/YwlC family tRNA threonylcarbamoyl adenosine modification protein [Polytolypa hystricis UAMH7299]